MGVPRVSLAIDNRFAAKRWPSPSEWMYVAGSLGLRYVEANTDTELDPLHMGSEYLRRWSDEVRNASESGGCRVCALRSGEGVGSTLGLLHPDEGVRRRFCDHWVKPLVDLAADLHAVTTFRCHGLPDRALQQPEEHHRQQHSLISILEELSEYAGARFVDFKGLMDGGLIVQQSPLNRIRSKEDFTPASAEHKGETVSIGRSPTEAEYADLLFGWQVEQGITSNSVIYVKDGVTVGIGTGEQDRVGVAEIAIFKAYTKYADALCFRMHGMPYKDLLLQVDRGERDRGLIEEIDGETRKAKGGLVGAAMVSDAFFPFRDGVDVALREGVRAIVQPGGSLRDWEVIQACNEAEPPATMVFTGQRAFKH